MPDAHNSKTNENDAYFHDVLTGWAHGSDTVHTTQVAVECQQLQSAHGAASGSQTLLTDFPKCQTAEPKQRTDRVQMSTATFGGAASHDRT